MAEVRFCFLDQKADMDLKVKINSLGKAFVYHGERVSCLRAGMNGRACWGHRPGARKAVATKASLLPTELLLCGSTRWQLQLKSSKGASSKGECDDETQMLLLPSRLCLFKFHFLIVFCCLPPVFFPGIPVFPRSWAVGSTRHSTLCLSPL